MRMIIHSNALSMPLAVPFVASPGALLFLPKSGFPRAECFVLPAEMPIFAP